MNRFLTPFVRPADRPFDRDIRGLTSLRFFAAFMVVLYHFRYTLPIPIDQHTRFFTNGHLAVDLFFVLSGFILTHVYIREVERGTFSARDFIRKRFARLYPVHFATLSAYVLLLVVYPELDRWAQNGERYYFGAVPANLLMVHAWGFTDGLTLNFPSWSISAEWYAYLLFAPLAYGVVRSRIKPVALLSVAAIVLGVCWFTAPLAFGTILTKLTWNFGILRIVPEFLLGMAVYRLGCIYDLDERAARIALFGCVAGLLLVGHFDLSDVLAVPLFALLILTVAMRSRHGTRGILESRICVYLGEVSYSIYMVHPICFTVLSIAFLNQLGTGLYADLKTPLWIASVGVVILASIVSYHLIEVPGRRILSRSAPKTLQVAR